MLDPTRFGAYIDHVRSLPITTVAAGHSPALHGGRLERAWELLYRLPTMPAAPLLGNADLEAILDAHLSTV